MGFSDVARRGGEIGGPARARSYGCRVRERDEQYVFLGFSRIFERKIKVWVLKMD